MHDELTSVSSSFPPSWSPTPHTRCWDARSMQKGPVRTLLGHSHWAVTCRYNPFHDQLMLSGGTDNGVNLWRIASCSRYVFVYVHVHVFIWTFHFTNSQAMCFVQCRVPDLFRPSHSSHPHPLPHPLPNQCPMAGGRRRSGRGWIV
jgi:WD40 repeat protein